MATDIFGNPLDEEERFRQMMEQQRMGLLPGLLGGSAVDTFSGMPSAAPSYGPFGGGIGRGAYQGTMGMGTPTILPGEETINITPAAPTLTGYDRGPSMDAGIADPTGGLAATDPSLQGLTPFSQASLTPQTSSLTPFTPRATATPQPTVWDHLQKQQAPVVPEASMVTRPEVVRGPGRLDPALEARRMQALNPRVETPQIQARVPQTQASVPQRQAAARFVAPTYTAPAEIAPIDVEAIRSTVTAPAPFDFSDVSGGRLAEARKYAGQGMFGRAKQQIELGGGDWSTAMHRALRGETGMSAADLAKAKDAAVQQATRAREAQHAANVSAAKKKHAANVLAAQKRHAAKAQGAAAKRAAAAKVAAARQAVIDAQMEAETAARLQQQQDAAKAEADRIAAAAVTQQQQQDAAVAAAVAAASLPGRTTQRSGREGDTGSDEFTGEGTYTGDHTGEVADTYPFLNLAGLIGAGGLIKGLLKTKPTGRLKDIMKKGWPQSARNFEFDDAIGGTGKYLGQAVRDKVDVHPSNTFPNFTQPGWTRHGLKTSVQSGAAWSAERAAAKAAFDSAKQAALARNAALVTLAAAANSDRGGPSQAEIDAAIEVMTEVDTFGGGGLGLDAYGAETEAEVAAAVADEGGFY